MTKNLGCAIIVSGPSGVGKSTICGEVRKALPNLGFSISCTTRAPRGEEQHGIEYFFLSEQEFDQHIDCGNFVEHANVFNRRYGTLKSQIIDQVQAGIDVFLDIDVQGAMQIKKACENDELLAKVCEFVFIGPPSFEILKQRLISRNTDSTEQQELRLATAQEELEYAKFYDFLLINEHVDQTTQDMLSLIHSFKLSTKRCNLEF